MIKTLTDQKEMSFLFIEEQYHDKYILVKVVDINDSTGKETGIPLCTGDSFDELVRTPERRSNRAGTIVLQGIDFEPMIGGLI